MALRLQSEQYETADQIRAAFQIILLRDPTEQELERLSRYVKEMTAYHDNVHAAEVEYPARITRSLVEEFSGETFEYDEILPVFENYHADEKPSEVSSETRALADMCLLLFNTNEFFYIE